MIINYLWMLINPIKNNYFIYSNIIISCINNNIALFSFLYYILLIIIPFLFVYYVLDQPFIELIKKNHYSIGISLFLYLLFLVICISFDYSLLFTSIMGIVMTMHCCTDLVERSLYLIPSIILLLTGFCYSMYLNISIWQYHLFYINSSLFLLSLFLFMCYLVILFLQEKEQLIGDGDIILFYSLIMWYDLIDFLIIIALSSIAGSLLCIWFLKYRNIKFLAPFASLMYASLIIFEFFKGIFSH